MVTGTGSRFRHKRVLKTGAQVARAKRTKSDWLGSVRMPRPDGAVSNDDAADGANAHWHVY